MGAFDELASSTNFIIWAKVVSSPTLWASNLKKPDLLILAPTTLSPAFFSTGMLSPVSIDSSIDELPNMIVPSTGIDCPGLTIIISPFNTSSTGISLSIPFLSTNAVFGDKSISFLMASEVLPFALASKYLPNVIKAKTTAADSKYKSIENCIAMSMSICPRPYPILYMA